MIRFACPEMLYMLYENENVVDSDKIQINILFEKFLTEIHCQANDITKDMKY